MRGDVERIEELHQADVRASKAGDYATLRSIMSEDAVVMPPDGRLIRGRDAPDHSFAAMHAAKPATEVLEYEFEFAAPKHLVYKAWTTPELVKRWWSGRRGKVTSAEIDLRVGGMWRYVMVANGGFEVAFHGEYREIVPNDRIVTTDVFETHDPPEGEPPLNTVAFTEVDGRTILTRVAETWSKELRDTILDSGMEIGMQEQMELLEEIAISLR